MDSFEETDNELSDNENMLDAEELFEDDDDGDGDGKNEMNLLETEKRDSDEEDAKQEKKKDSELKTVKKRIVRNPRLTLNFERLKSEYGLPALAKIFEKFKFKGKHHEKEDLTAIMQNLEHWMCHFLYPGYDDQTCIRILEKLGKKRVVQAHMRQLRREAKEKLHKPEDNICNENEGDVQITNSDFDAVNEENSIQTEN